jgi:hypothetical protein
MSTTAMHRTSSGTTALRRAAPAAPHAAFAAGLFLLASALVVNTVLGPLGAETIRYPISGTLLNQTIGLEVVTVGLVAPLSLVAGLLALRGHRAAPFLAFGAAAYAAYMFAQYVLGPEYAHYRTTVLFHTLVFMVATAISVWAWVLASQQPLPPLTDRGRRVRGLVLLLLAAFITSRYLSVVTGGAMPPEFARARTFFWSIFLLDLGIVVPATLIAGVGLLRGARLADTALYALLGWYALVPPSVAAMSATMVVNDDPHAVLGQAVTLGVTAVVAVGLAAWIYLPLFRDHRSSTPSLVDEASS